MPLLKANKGTLCIVASDPDNLAIVLLAEHLLTSMDNGRFTKVGALEMLKERRPTSNPLRQLTDCLDAKNHQTPQLLKKKSKV